VTALMQQQKNAANKPSAPQRAHTIP
jgi:hypothetical protein